MDASRFDALTRAMSPNTRRGLLGLGLRLPVLGGLLAVLGVADADARKRGKKKRKKKRKKQCKKQRRTICNGKCGTVKDKCKKKIDCGSCGAPGEECQGGVCVQTCTLQDTADLQQAITDTPEGGELVLCAGIWDLTTTVSITKDLTLRGAGADLTILDGPAMERVLTITGNSDVTLQDLTVTGGQAVDGGGIANAGELTLRHMTVTGNTATFRGGGIYNNASGTLTLEAGSRV